MGVKKERLRIAGEHWVTDNVANLFDAEIANEQYGGITPATLHSTIDSVSQAVEIMCQNWEPRDFAALLMVVDLVGSDVEVRDVLRAAGRYE